MSTDNIGFYKEIAKIIFQLSSKTHFVCSSASFGDLLVRIEPRCEKTGLRGFRLVRHKPGSTTMEDGWRLEILY